jgi:hypothetical protein
VDLLGFSGGGRLFSTKRLSALEKIAEFLRRQSCAKLEMLTVEMVFGKIARRKVARNGEWLNPHIVRKLFLLL